MTIPVFHSWSITVRGDDGKKKKIAYGRQIWTGPQTLEEISLGPPDMRTFREWLLENGFQRQDIEAEYCQD